VNSIKIIEIKQIYNFIVEYPEINEIKNIDRIQKFMSSYYYGKYTEMNVFDDMCLLNIKLYDGTDLKFDIKTLPNFLYKEDFLRWCTNYLVY
jgi:hypothetical protein